MANSQAPRLRLQIDGDGATATELEDIGRRARDAKPVMRVILGLMHTAQTEQFITEGVRGGRKWKKDTDAWIERKRRKGFHLDTEMRLGDLREALTVTSGGEFAGEVRHVGKTSAVYGTTIFYARFQGHRRQLLLVTLHDMDRYAELMVDYLLTGNVPGGGAA